MNWKKRLFKPKWQNKNADVRLESVSSDHDPDLIANLVEIATSDQDSRVRCAAVKRLHQLKNILKLYEKEQHPDVRSLLEDRIRQLAAATNESRPELELRLKVVDMTKNRELIEHLASHAPEPDLRRAAISKITRQGVLGDCCINDTNAEIRKFAASQITQQTTLKRVIDGLRKRDKQLFTELQKRLHKEQLEQGNPAAVEAEALKICVSLEKLALDGGKSDKDSINKLHKAWQPLDSKVSEAVKGRYHRVCERLTEPDSSAGPVKTETPVEKTQPKPEVVTPSHQVTEAPEANKKLARIATDVCLYETDYEGRFKASRVRKMREQLERIWNQCTPPHTDDQACWDTASKALEEMEGLLEQAARKQEQQLEKANSLLEQMESELEDGELHKALETRAKIHDVTRDHQRNRDWDQFNGKMMGLQARLRELRDWHHWSNNKIRKRLIAEMEVLPAADLHPDALLDRIKSLQTEWKALEKSEQIPGDKKFMAEAWMWRKFSDAGHKAFETAKPYLDKRSEIQSRLKESMNAFCKELDEIIQAQPTDWAALNKGISTGRKKLRELGALPIQHRQKTARKIKNCLDKGNELIQANYKVIEQEKMKLIRAASQLVHVPEKSEAIAQAKSLQANWKTAGRLWRSRDQELWEQFREHLDPLFSELKEQQATIRKADDERLAVQKDLCKQLKDILKNKDDLGSLHGRVQGLQDSWKDIEHPDRKLLQNFEGLVADYQKKLDLEQTLQIKSNRRRWWEKSALLHELIVNGWTQKGTLSKKAEKSINASWPQDESLEAFEKELDQLRTEILAGNVSRPAEDDIEAMQAEARLLCISLEFIAGLPSPESDRDARMKYQVDRLANSMSGESTRLSVTEETMQAEQTWLKMYALPDTDFQAFGDRVNQALSAINETT